MSTETTRIHLLKSPTTLCMLPAQRWLFISTQSQALARPPSQAQRKSRQWGTCPHLATSKAFWLTGLIVLHWAPSIWMEAPQTEGDSLKPSKSPNLGLSSTHTGSGIHAWLGSGGAKAHLIHDIQLGHLFPVAGAQEIAVQPCYLR